jgi:hypothetical protein
MATANGKEKLPRWDGDNVRANARQENRWSLHQQTVAVRAPRYYAVAVGRVHYMPLHTTQTVLTVFSGNATMAWYGAVLDTFFQDPVCPSTSLQDGFEDSDIDPDSLTTLIPRDGIPDATIGMSDIHFLVGAPNGASWLSTQIRDVYDDHVARGKPDSEGMIDAFAYDDLQDPVSVAMDAWCTEADTLQMIETQHISDSRCVLEWNSTDTVNDLEKRRFQGNSVGREAVRSGNNARPNIGALLRRILDTEDLTFLYSRVLSYTNPEDPTGEARAEANLEGTQNGSIVCVKLPLPLT